jgi:hypothetical protein
MFDYNSDLFRHHNIKDLVLETREFDQLLGPLQPDGSRKVHRISVTFVASFSKVCVIAM